VTKLHFDYRVYLISLIFLLQVCDDCPNVKFVNEEKVLEVEIEAGKGHL